MHRKVYPNKITPADIPVPGQPDWLEAEVHDLDPAAKTTRKRKSNPRHKDWPKIRKHWMPIVELEGSWPNAHAAAIDILKKQKGLTIDEGTLRKGIPKYFPESIGIEFKKIISRLNDQLRPVTTGRLA